MKERLDRIFSMYIRLRDCETGRCISCGKRITPETSDCGHYVPRSHLATRWHEKNCNAQCKVCNQMEYGNLKGYTKGLMNKYGDGIIEELIQLKHSIVKMSKSDYEERIRYYTQKVKELT